MPCVLCAVPSRLIAPAAPNVPVLDPQDQSIDWTPELTDSLYIAHNHESYSFLPDMGPRMLAAGASLQVRAKGPDARWGMALLSSIYLVEVIIGLFRLSYL